jgi:hypothetical protein
LKIIRIEAADEAIKELQRVINGRLHFLIPFVHGVQETMARESSRICFLPAGMLAEIHEDRVIRKLF